jgi:hypothetical protein
MGKAASWTKQMPLGIADVKLASVDRRSGIGSRTITFHHFPTAVAHANMLRKLRTIADFAGAPGLGKIHVSGALSYWKRSWRIEDVH